MLGYIFSYKKNKSLTWDYKEFIFIKDLEIIIMEKEIKSEEYVGK